MFTPSQIKTTIRPNTFTAQDAGIYSNAELDQFWTAFYFLNIPSLHFNYSVKLLVTLLFHLLLPIKMKMNPYNTLRIGLHDKLLNLTPLFTPIWFFDAFIALFGYPCYILTRCGIYFSTFFPYKQL